MYGGSYLGTMFGGAVLSTIVGYYNLQAALAAQALALGAIMLFPLLLRERSTDKLFSLSARERPVGVARPNLFKNLYKAFARRSPLLSAVLALGIMLSTQTLTAVLTVLLMKKLGWSQEAYGQMMGGLPLLLGLSGSVVGGWLADRIGHKKMVAIASVALGLVYLVFGLSGAYWANDDFILAYYCAQELCTGTLSAAIFALLMGVAWPQVAASQFTAFMALSNLGRSLGGKLAGPLTEAFGTAGTFIGLGVYQVLIVSILLLIDPHQNRRELGEAVD
jgi:PAT family beta-lactamase induction signal transducer AmpG